MIVIIIIKAEKGSILTCGTPVSCLAGVTNVIRLMLPGG